MTDAQRKWLAVAVGLAALLIVGSQLLLAGPSPSPTPSTTSLPTASTVIGPLATLAATTTQPKITWSTTSINVILSPGESTSSDLSFTSSQLLTNVTLSAVPEIAPFVSLQPSTISSLAANQVQSVHISIAIPSGITLGTYSGTIHVLSGSQTLPRTLKLVVNIWNTFGDSSLGLSFLYPPNFIVSPVAPSQNTGVYLESKQEEYGGEGITISRKEGNLADAIAHLNSQLTLLSRFDERFGSADWTLLVHREQASGLEFFTAITEQNGTVVAVGSRNIPSNGPLVMMMLNTFVF